MSDYTLTIKSTEKKGVLDDITDVITSHGANISYVHLFVERNNVGSINLELEHVEDIDDLIKDLKNIDEVKSIELHGSQLDIYGKRIIIVGGGAQVSQVAMARVSALVLAGSLMGGEITKAVRKVKEESNLIVISLNMPGSVTDYADLIITDPIQAGVLAVMSVADTAVFDIKRLGDNIKF